MRVRDLCLTPKNLRLCVSLCVCVKVYASLKVRERENAHLGRYLYDSDNRSSWQLLEANQPKSKATFEWLHLN